MIVDNGTSLRRTLIADVMPVAGGAMIPRRFQRHAGYTSRPSSRRLRFLAITNRGLGMPKTLLHDAGRGAEVKRRVEALTPDATRRWGKMSIDQVLHHVNLVLAESLGEYTAKPNVRGLPKPLVRWVILNLPWGKGAPTRPDMLIPQGQHHDFAREKERCLSMIDRFLAKPMDDAWPPSANFPMTGRHWSQLQYKHLDHHLTQFGV